MKSFKKSQKILKKKDLTSNIFNVNEDIQKGDLTPFELLDQTQKRNINLDLEKLTTKRIDSLRKIKQVRIF